MCTLKSRPNKDQRHGQQRPTLDSDKFMQTQLCCSAARSSLCLINTHNFIFLISLPATQTHSSAQDCQTVGSNSRSSSRKLNYAKQPTWWPGSVSVLNPTLLCCLILSHRTRGLLVHRRLHLQQLTCSNTKETKCFSTLHTSENIVRPKYDHRD